MELFALNSSICGSMSGIYVAIAGTIPILLILGLVGFVVFIAYEATMAAHPLICDLSFFLLLSAASRRHPQHALHPSDAPGTDDKCD